jgi:uncharacterized protein (DUF4415 family)
MKKNKKTNPKDRERRAKAKLKAKAKSKIKARKGRGIEIRAVAESDLAAKYQRWFKPIKKPVTLRLDADVLDWFQREGDGYQTRINRALRELMMRQKKQS